MVDVVLDRQVHDLAGGVASDDDTDLGCERDALLQHATHAAEGIECIRQGRPVGDALLALAVVAEARRLEDAGKEGVVDACQVCRRGKNRMRHARHAGALERRLLERPVLADGDRGGRWAHGARCRQRLERRCRHILELRRDRRGLPRHRHEAVAVEIGTPHMAMGDQARRAGRIGVEHHDGIAGGLRGVGEHAAELATAEDTERRAWRDEGSAAHRRRWRADRRGRRRVVGCLRAHFRSADIARAASR